MEIRGERRIETDVLVIGSGLAGLRAAIEARRYGLDVHLVDKSIIGYNNNSRFSGGGIRGSLVSGLPKDYEGNEYVTVYRTPEDHFKDCLRVGEFLNDQPLTEAMCFDAPARIMELRDFGVEHVPYTYLHYSFPHGTGIVKPLVETVQTLGVKTIRRSFVSDLLVQDGAVVGAVGFDLDSQYLLYFITKSVILATGGGGRLYERNEVTNTTTGDGVGMAYRAGAELVNMEMVHFEPYVHSEPDLPLMDRHESQAGFYAPLRNKLGEDFLPNYIKRIGSPKDPFDKQFGVFMPDIRHHVSRAMATEVYEGRGDKGAVFFDLPTVPEEKWTADIASGYLEKVLCRGHDVRKQSIHVFPGTIVTLGGVKINEQGETSLAGLFAGGEVTGGVHGAMRLGGNALTNAMVFGARAGNSAAKRALSVEKVQVKEATLTKGHELINSIIHRPPREGCDPKAIKKKIQRIMQNHVGILRKEEDLEKAIDLLQDVRDKFVRNVYASEPVMLRDAVEVVNLIDGGLATARSALMRKESRGGHFRLDFPFRDDEKWLQQIIIFQSNGEMKLDTRPPRLTRYKPGDLPSDSILAKVLEGIWELRKKKYGGK